MKTRYNKLYINSKIISRIHVPVGFWTDENNLKSTFPLKTKTLFL